MRCIASWQGLNGWFCVAIQQLYCDKGCRVAEIVLQYGGLEGLEGLFFLYCNIHGVLWLRRDLGLRIVLQYNYYIAT